MTLYICIDQAADSGVALIRPGDTKPFWWMLAKNHRDRSEALGHALTEAGEDARSIHALLECHDRMPLLRGTRYDRKHTGAPDMNTATVLGMGAARGRWQERLDLLGVPKTHQHKASPQEWRSKVLGPRFTRASSEVAKAEAVRYCQALLGLELDHNVAEACCIAVYAARELPALIPVRRRA